MASNMPTDYSIMEQELLEDKKNLERKLHMVTLRRLCKKQSDLAKFEVQRKQIESLEKQLAELEPQVSTVYCPQHALKDNEVNGYLVYLLKMKDAFAREVKTKEGMIKQVEEQIKAENRKLCSVVNEQGKLKKNAKKGTSEFTRLENLSNQLYQLNVRVNNLKTENRQTMENIKNMRKQKDIYRGIEKNLRKKIERCRFKKQELLDKAVSAYEEKDELMSKAKVFEERRAQDERKTAINENSLDLCYMRTDKNEAFRNLQDIVRTDIRISETSEMIQKGVTGLETNIESMKELRSAIQESAAVPENAAEEENAAIQENPAQEENATAQENISEKVEESFKKARDNIDVQFSYLDQLLIDIHQLQSEIRVTKEENRRLIKNVSSSDRKWRMDVKTNQEKAQETLEEADEASKKSEEARRELNESLDVLKKLYAKCCPDDEASLVEKPIDDSNALDYLKKQEKQLLDYLICNEYIKMKEAPKEKIPLVTEEDDDDKNDIDEDMKEKEAVSVLQPRPLSSKSDLQAVDDLDSETSVLGFEELKKIATAVMGEIQSEEGEEDKTE